MNIWDIVIMRTCLTIAAAVLSGMAAFFVASAPQAQPGPPDAPSAVPQIPDREAWLADCIRHFMQALVADDPDLTLFSTPGAVSMKVVVDIAPDGTVQGVRIKETSGRKALDAVAIRALSRVRRVPPFSPDMPPRNIQVQLPIGARVS